MPLSLKQKLSTIPLLLYWPVLFTLMHIPIPGSGRWKVTIGISDKILHCLAYLILVFVVWFALKQDAKVNWRKAITWWIILGMAIYSIIDEWLQLYVGRDPDIMDFAADAFAVLTGLGLLSVIPFYPAALAITGVCTCVLIQFLRVNFSAEFPMLVTAFYILLFSFFTLLWMQCMRKFKQNGNIRWLAAVFSGPIVFLLTMESFYAIKGGNFNLSNTIAAMLAITGIIILYYMHMHSSDKNNSL